MVVPKDVYLRSTWQTQNQEAEHLHCQFHSLRRPYVLLDLGRRARNLRPRATPRPECDSPARDIALLLSEPLVGHSVSLYACTLRQLFGSR
jgi:hypothetical protein